jgi:hypothetical protein
MDTRANQIVGILSDLYFPHAGDSNVYQFQKNEILKILEEVVKTRFQYCKEFESKNDLDSLKRSASELKNTQEEISKYKNGTNSILPQWLFVYNEAKNRKIPCVIVTSLNHHSASFEPFKFKDFFINTKLQPIEKYIHDKYSIYGVKGKRCDFAKAYLEGGDGSLEEIELENGCGDLDSLDS